MSNATYVSGADLFASWRQGIEVGQPSKTWSVGQTFDHVEVGPGRVILVGGAPGSGKTALIMQWAFDALSLDSGLRVVVANVEMSPAALLNRQLARLSGVELTKIRKRQFGPDDPAKLAKGFERIGRVLDRLAFVLRPNDLDRIAGAVDDFAADLIVLDYIQRIDPPGRFNSTREKINGLMSFMRTFANAGRGLVAASALTRSGKGKSSYAGKHLGLASFRESSELEYGADDCFLLYPSEEDADPADSVRLMTLDHAKSRDGETQDAVLKFHRPFQRFEGGGFSCLKVKPASTSPASSAKDSWSKTSGNGSAQGALF
jgi:replicative DNA helicase